MVCFMFLVFYSLLIVLWYDALEKPSWTPSGMTIGMIWAVLFGLIALSVALFTTTMDSSQKYFGLFSF